MTSPFHDPARPGLPGAPRWFNDWGVLPGIYATPEPDGQSVCVEIMVPRAHNSFDRKVTTIPIADLPQLLHDYFVDPEGCVDTYWGCTVPEKGVPPKAVASGSTLTLEDLL